MRHFAVSRRRVVLASIAAATATVGVLPALGTTPATATAGRGGRGDFLGNALALQDFDVRGWSTPTAAQRALAGRLGAEVTWNRFGTPHSISRVSGWVATGLSRDPATAARQWVSANRRLFRLSADGLARLELLNVNPIGDGAAVLFRQRFGDLTSAYDGLLTVGVTGGKVAYVSSSIAGDGATPPAPRLSPTDALLVAARNVGVRLDATDVLSVKRTQDWTLLGVRGLRDPQRTRLRALPDTDGSVHAVYETDVIDLRAAQPIGAVVLVDAVGGKVLRRENRVDYASEPTAGQFSGKTGTGACGPAQKVDVPAGSTSISAVASANDPSNDIVIRVTYNGKVVASQDTATSPEAVRYTQSTGLPAGSYAVQVCPFDRVPPFDYTGVYAVDGAPAAGLPYPPRWRVFKATPSLDYRNTDTRQTWCWATSVDGNPVPGCDVSAANAAARGPWDLQPFVNVPSFTTQGNAALTAGARFDPNTVALGALGPGEMNRPYAADRNYSPAFTNEWSASKCDPTVLANPKGADVDAATVNLFAGHNRMHDWAYRLGFTEEAYNLQQTNFGNANGQVGPYPVGRDADPEQGNVQAGGVSGGPWLQAGGRDNANQLTLQDGVPGITNQYFFQPLAGSFYAPCIDGDFDATVWAHEYTHAISNRMVSGPDSGLSGLQAGSMGESWSDLVAMEQLNEYNLLDRSQRYVIGGYATGDRKDGIRNYALDRDPLNYSDVGYDSTGPEVHADGEIWNAVNFALRSRLTAKYDRTYPSSNASLQRACADGTLPATRCPGNRRWIQIVFDAFLLQPSDTSMVDARNAYLAADKLRFGGANQRELWAGFAATGLGKGATTKSTDDDQPTPSFVSPYERNADLRFRPVSADGGAAPRDVKVYVGDYEARVTPIADTDPKSRRGDRAAMTPGTYRFVVQAPGFGAVRFSRTVRPGERVDVVVPMPRNVASAAAGAKASGDGVNLKNLIDDTEATNWASIDSPVKGKAVTVDLAGRHAVRVGRVQVSALTHPGCDDLALPLLDTPCTAEQSKDPDHAPQNRFTQLRQFQIAVCNADAHQNCADPKAYHVVFTSRSDAFPAVKPRPRAPQAILRSFDIPATMATHVQIRVVSNQCLGYPGYRGEQDNDPTNDTDCSTTANADDVRIAELQVFTR